MVGTIARLISQVAKTGETKRFPPHFWNPVEVTAAGILSTPTRTKNPISRSFQSQNKTRKSADQLPQFSKIEIEPHKPKKGPPTRSLFLLRSRTMSQPARLCAFDLPSGRTLPSGHSQRRASLPPPRPRLPTHRRHNSSTTKRWNASPPNSAPSICPNCSAGSTAGSTASRRVVRLYPDVQLALRIASDRLQRRIDAELAFETFARQYPMPDMNSPEFNKLFETHMESMI